MKVAVVHLPGSNCDQDALFAFRELGVRAEYVWHEQRIGPAYDAVVIPGGFTFGDYLRCGAIARFSPAVESVVEMARSGAPVLGVCNGFQVLCEAGLLPGALVRNAGQKFVCRDVRLRVEAAGTALTRGVAVGRVLRIPVAHGEGCYVFPEGARPNVVFRYCDPAGETTPEANPNGSQDNVAGICNEAGNVVGMMPHPERAFKGLLGSDDGRVLLESFASVGVAAL